MTTTSPSLTIVVGCDRSPQAELALDQALHLARGGGGAVVHVLGVADGAGTALEADGFAGAAAAEVAAVQAAVATRVEAALDHHGRPGVRVFVHARHGDAAAEIVALAAEVQAGLVIVGTHGRHGLDRLMIGSVAEKVMRRARCPVLVMRPTDYPGVGDDELRPEPPCPRCVAARADSDGAAWWCERHGRAWVQPHRYAYTDDGVCRLRPDEWPLW
jgi:nucleotide-binding universal stress UspA family protein